MPRLPKNRGEPAAWMQMSGARADSRITVQAQTELNPSVQQPAAFNFAPLSDDFDALSLRCNGEGSF
jgi:hypothetical protein